MTVQVEVRRKAGVSQRKRASALAAADGTHSPRHARLTFLELDSGEACREGAGPFEAVLIARALCPRLIQQYDPTAQGAESEGRVQHEAALRLLVIWSSILQICDSLEAPLFQYDRSNTLGVRKKQGLCACATHFGSDGSLARSSVGSRRARRHALGAIPELYSGERSGKRALRFIAGVLPRAFFLRLVEEHRLTADRAHCDGGIQHGDFLAVA